MLFITYILMGIATAYFFLLTNIGKHADIDDFVDNWGGTTVVVIIWPVFHIILTLFYLDRLLFKRLRDRKSTW